MQKTLQTLTITSLLATTSLLANQAVQKKSQFNQNSLSFEAEAGTIGILNHKIKFGKNGTYFDLKEDGGQANLYPFYRFSANWNLEDQSYFNFLYQPLEIATRVTLRQQEQFDDLVFAKGERLNVLYSFPFYRISYFSNIWFGDELLYVGGALQIRNANIEFENLEGTKRRDNRNVGPVPLIVARYDSKMDDDTNYGGEISTFYAPVKYLNGSDSDVVGGFTDASFYVGRNFDQNKQLKIRLRYLGGGAEGTSKDPKYEFEDGFNSNWIDALTFSVGLTSFF